LTSSPIVLLYSFGSLVRQLAEVENDMNSIERLTHYATEIEQETPHELPDAKPPKSWPAEGHVELDKVVLSYRPGLPVVLKGTLCKHRQQDH
jgi:ABC-type multidrug transport system fused ATPase/permease subunit